MLESVGKFEIRQSKVHVLLGVLNDGDRIPGGTGWRIGGSDS